MLFKYIYVMRTLLIKFSFMNIFVCQLWKCGSDLTENRNFLVAVMTILLQNELKNMSIKFRAQKEI